MIPAFLLTRFGPQGAKVVFLGGILLAVLLIGLSVYMIGRSDGKAGEVVKRQEAQIELQQDISEADKRAAHTRVDDAVRAEKERKELDDAFKDIGSPDARRARRGCIILRQQGRDTTGIPGCQ